MGDQTKVLISDIKVYAIMGSLNFHFKYILLNTRRIRFIKMAMIKIIHDESL